MGEKAAASLGLLFGLVGGAIPITSALYNRLNNPYFEISREPFERVQKIESTLNLLERDKKRLSTESLNYPQYIPDRVRDEIEASYGSLQPSAARINSLEKSISAVREDLAAAEKHPSILEYNRVSEGYFFNLEAPDFLMLVTGLSGLAGVIGGFIIGFKGFKKPSQQLPSYRLSHCDGGPKA